MLCSSLVCFNTQSLISLCFTVVHCKPINQCKDITCLNVTFTATQCSAGKSKAVALAPSTALRLAAALCQLLTTLGNRWKVCPENVPQTIFFSPTPLCRILCFWFMYCWLTPDAAWLSLAKTSDTSVYASQVSHADFFPLPRKADTTSHPVNAWKNRICLVFARPMARQSSCTGIHLRLFPWPKETKETQRCWRPLCCRDLFCCVP